MNNIMIMRKIQHEQQLNCKSSHDDARQSAFEEPRTESAQRLAQQLKDQTDMRPVGPGMLEV
jgi:hypothetical protein